MDMEKMSSQTTSAWTVLWCTVLMSLATGLGALPFYFTTRLNKRTEGACHAMAVGVMIAASYSLIQESEGLGNAWVVLGVACGTVFIDRCQRFLAAHQDLVEFSGLKGMDAKKAVLFVGVMTLHAVGEGCGVGVSFGGPGGFREGLLVTLAIGLHNIPEGLATATVLASKGVGVRELTAWTIITALPQALLAVPAFAFVRIFSQLFPFFAGFAAGCMIWISFAELVPDALESISPKELATATTATTAAFKALQYAIDWALEEANEGASSDSKGGLAPPLFLLVVLGLALAMRTLTRAANRLRANKTFSVCVEDKETTRSFEV